MQKIANAFCIVIYPNLTLMSEINRLEIRAALLETPQPCEVCEQCNSKYQCNKCGASVCDELLCSEIYPHRFNQQYCICADCFNDILHRFKPLPKSRSNSVTNTKEKEEHQ